MRLTGYIFLILGLFFIYPIWCLGKMERSATNVEKIAAAIGVVLFTVGGGLLESDSHLNSLLEG